MDFDICNNAPHTRRILMQRALLGVAGLLGVNACARIAYSANTENAIKKVQRVVAANNATGKSYLLSNEQVPLSGNVWQTTIEMPLGAGAPGEPAKLLPPTAPHLDPPPGGTRWQFATIPPWTEMRPLFEAGKVQGHDARGFHRTSTIDYVLVLNGELHLLLDQGEVVLHEGDMVIQRNTLHSWQNHTNTPVNLHAILMRPNAT